MESVTIEMAAAPGGEIRVLHYPELYSENRLVARGIAVLRQHAPRVLRYLSLQRLLGRLPLHPIAVRADGLSEAEVRARLAAWMRGKSQRRLLYVVLELLLMPFTAFVAVLPGPNVIFYGLFVLFYFHFKAFLSLSRIKVEDLDITILRDA